MNNKNSGIGLKSAALIAILAAASIGLTGILYSRSASRTQEAAVNEPLLENLAVSTQPAPAASEPSISPSAPASSLPSTPTVPTVIASEPVQEAIAEETPARHALATASPVNGDTIGEYAMDCLSYNETTRDWRIHNGVDLAAEAGAPVCAAADGTVYTTYEDDTLGFTVVLRHEGGYTTRYSSLREDLCVKPGDTVTLGQTIGYASDSALVESVMGSHVHFSVSCQDVPMDPDEFLSLG